MVLEIGVNGVTVARYLRGLELIAREQDGKREYYHQNGHGDIILRTDAWGNALKAYEYDAFGVEQGREKLDTNPFRYCGEYWDEETETVYLRARNYRPAVGSFWSEDPARDGLHWYAYCAGNPVSFVDPSGCGFFDKLKTAVKSVVNGVDSFVTGIAQGVAESMTFGVAGLLEPYTTMSVSNQLSYFLGKIVGNAVVMVAGVVVGTGGAGFGIVTSPTGAGAVAGVGVATVAYGMAGSAAAGMIANAAIAGQLLNQQTNWEQSTNNAQNSSSSATGGESGTQKSGIPVPEKTKASNGLDYQSNPKHTLGQPGNSPNAGIEPQNSLELFGNSVQSTKNPNQRYAYDESTGTLHRFFNDGNGTWHWSGSTNQGQNSIRGTDVPNDIKNIFDLPKKGW